MLRYKANPLAHALGIRRGIRLLRVNSPPGLEDWLAPLPDTIISVFTPGRDADVILLFTHHDSELRVQLDQLKGGLLPRGEMWVAWPTRGSGLTTNLTEAIVREVGIAAGLVDSKTCSIHEVWSGLRFIHRPKDRP